MTKGLFNGKTKPISWVEGFVAGEDAGRGHARTAISRMLRARAMVLEQSIQDKNEAEQEIAAGKMVSKLGIDWHLNVEMTMAQIKELYEVATAVDAADWEGKDIESND